MLKKALLPVILSFMLGCGLLVGCSQTESAANGDSGAQAENDSITVAIAVTPGMLANSAKAESLQPYEQVKDIKLKAGSTVYDALIADGVEVEGDQSSINAINGIGSGVAGSDKGWQFTVNGEPGMGAPNEWEVHDGDVIIWYYGVPEE